MSEPFPALQCRTWYCLRITELGSLPLQKL
jgi:hypothetical protein